MTNDDLPEYVSLPDRMHDEMAKRTAQMFGGIYKEIKEHKAPTQNDLDEIKKALKYILERLTSLDRYVREHRFKPGQYEKQQDVERADNKPYKEIE